MELPNLPIAAIGAFIVVGLVSVLNTAGIVRRYGVFVGVGLVAVTLALGWYGAGFPALQWGL